MGMCVNHKRVLRAMKQYYILSKVRRKKKKYMNGTKPVVALHRLKRQFEASAPNEKWFMDDLESVLCIYQRLWMPLIVKL